MKVMRSEELRKHITSTYTGLRYGLVVIAFAFPVILWFGGLLRDSPTLRGSLSAYYHTSMRDYFVGALFAIGACLYLYKGFTPKENYALNLAALFAVGVAVFPMDPPAGAICSTFTWGNAHGVCAILSFACIAFVCWFCAADTLSLLKDQEQIKKYRRSYKTLGILMLLSPVVAAILSLAWRDGGTESRWVFFAEVVAMYVFAAYWLIKSREIATTHAEEKACAQELALNPVA